MKTAHYCASCHFNLFKPLSKENHAEELDPTDKEKRTVV